MMSKLTFKVLYSEDKVFSWLDRSLIFIVGDQNVRELKMKLDYYSKILIPLLLGLECQFWIHIFKPITVNK